MARAQRLGRRMAGTASVWRSSRLQCSALLSSFAHLQDQAVTSPETYHLCVNRLDSRCSSWAASHQSPLPHKTCLLLLLSPWRAKAGASSNAYFTPLSVLQVTHGVSVELVTVVPPQSPLVVATIPSLILPLAQMALLGTVDTSNHIRMFFM